MKRGRGGAPLGSQKRSGSASGTVKGKKKEPTVVTCPMCDARVPFASVNMHLDTCTGRPGVAPTSQASTSPASAAAPDSPSVTSAVSSLFSPSPPSPSPPVSASEGHVAAPRPAKRARRTGEFGRRPDTGTGISREGQRGQGHGHGRRHAARLDAPLADRMRPRRFEDLVGQQDAAGMDSALRLLVQRDAFSSIILWGPPGCGKSTVAHMIRGYTRRVFKTLSAVTAGVKDVREVVQQARNVLQLQRRRTVLFVDEIHRFNKAQQDAFLPHVESGLITLIGATTENPSFALNSALLSRCRVVVLHKLTPSELAAVLKRAVADKDHGLGAMDVTLDDDVCAKIAAISDGDARAALNALELAAKFTAERKPPGARITLEAVQRALQKSHLLYDRSGEQHYNIISALHKSMRGSDVDASLYWLGRMLVAGEDARYVARRMIRFASEDVGMADPQALPQAIAAAQSVQLIGMPEASVCLAQCAVYLASAPKSVAVYQAYKRVETAIKTRPAEPVPLHIRNAPTKLMKDVGYGKGYVYPPSATKEEAAAQTYLPTGLQGTKFYHAGKRGDPDMAC